jgi:hypothetical protein
MDCGINSAAREVGYLARRRLADAETRKLIASLVKLSNKQPSVLLRRHRLPSSLTDLSVLRAADRSQVASPRRDRIASKAQRRPSRITRSNTASTPSTNANARGSDGATGPVAHNLDLSVVVDARDRAGRHVGTPLDRHLVVVADLIGSQRCQGAALSWLGHAGHRGLG